MLFSLSISLSRGRERREKRAEEEKLPLSKRKERGIFFFTFFHLFFLSFPILTRIWEGLGALRPPPLSSAVALAARWSSSIRCRATRARRPCPRRRRQSPRRCSACRRLRRRLVVLLAAAAATAAAAAAEASRLRRASLPRRRPTGPPFSGLTWASGRRLSRPLSPRTRATTPMVRESFCFFVFFRTEMEVHRRRKEREEKEKKSEGDTLENASASRPVVAFFARFVPLCVDLERMRSSAQGEGEMD